jgi:hypothetical protein
MEASQNFLRDNQISYHLISDGTKALRRELMSGETLRAPRQQLRPLHASAFVVLIQIFEYHKARASRRVFFLLKTYRVDLLWRAA